MRVEAEERRVHALMQVGRAMASTADYEQALAAESRVGGELSREQIALRVERSGAWVDGHLELAVEVDREVVGSIQARAPEPALPPGVCELGIELMPAARGRGVGTEAVRLLGRHLLSLGLNPGPRVGEILKAVYEQQLDGRVTTIEEAIEAGRRLYNR